MTAGAPTHLYACPSCRAAPGVACTFRGRQSFATPHAPRVSFARHMHDGPQDDDRVFVDGVKYHVAGAVFDRIVRLRLPFRKVITMTVDAGALVWEDRIGCWYEPKK